jgi:DNA primase
VGIREEDIARVRAATDFVSLAGEHLALKRVGRRLVGLCPFHVEKSPSFSVNSELGLYHCFGCGASGDVITFVREIEHLDFVDAVEKLANRAGITLHFDDEATGRDHQRRARIHEMLERAVAWYHERLLAGSDAGAARRYLRSRGYDGEVVRRYQLGWAPDGWDQLIRAMPFGPAALGDAGLAFVNESGRYNDFFRGRLLFPIYEPGGRPVGAGGRILPGGRGAKYKNTPGTAVYDKSRVLYGLNWAKKAVVDGGQVVVCEGYTDVIGLHQAGVAEAVATCGTALADGHVRLLTNFARRIVLAYDADAAGQSAAERYYEWERRFDVDIRVAGLPPGADPADLARSDPDGLRAAVAEARPYLAFRLERLLGRSELATAEGRARAAQGAVELVAAHPNPLVRDQYLMEVADRCRIEPVRLRSLLSEVSGGGDGRRSGSDAADRRGPTSAPQRNLIDLDDPMLGVGTAPPGPELEALRLAVHRPEEVAERLQGELFAHPLARAAYDALAASTTLHDAINGADPQSAALLQRLAVEEIDEPSDDHDALRYTDEVIRRLIEVAGSRVVKRLQAEARQSTDPAAFVPVLGWLKLRLESLRSESSAAGASRDDEQRLLAWIVDQSRADHVEAAKDPHLPAVASTGDRDD